MNTPLNSRKLSQFMIVLIMLSGLMSAYSQAAMVSTSDVINLDGTTYTTQDLQTALATEELKQQLDSLGVDATELNDRIASLTVEEIQQLNVELEQQAAGAGVLGILLTIFIGY